MKKIVMIIMVAAFALPAMAQQHEWQSTSTLQGTGSSYSSQVTAVGAVTANEMATTTDNYSPSNAPGRPRRTPIGGDGEDGWTSRTDAEGTDLSPIGDALIPLMLCAGAYLIIRARRRMVRSKVSEKGMEK